MTLASITEGPLDRFDAGVGQSRALAYTCLTNITSFLERLRNDINVVSTSPNVGSNWPVQMENVVEQTMVAPGKPTLPTPDIDLPVKPGLNDITIERFAIPEFNIPDPSIYIPDAPTVQWPTDPGSAPALDDVVVPDAPTVTLPDVPTFDPIAIPARPEYLVANFDGVRPNISLNPPGNLFVYEDQPYSSDVRDAVMAKVLDGIRNGGTGLGAEVEQAIWDRARNRLDEDMQVEIDRITDMFAASGCSRPSGPMMGAISRAQQEKSRKLSDLDKDILVQQSELAWKHTQQILDTGLKLEQISVDLHNKTMDRAFGAAKEVAQTALAAFEAEVKGYNLQLDQYKTDASVFEAKIRANLTTLEQHKTMIESARLESDIQSKAIEVYNAQLKGVMSLIEIYKSEMEGAKLKSEVQVQRLSAYKAQIEAYISRVNANVARFNAFSAQVAGEKAKVEVYSEQVNAFTSRVKAVEAQANTETAYARALSEANKSIIDGYESDITRYKADVEYAMKVQENVAKLYDSEVSGYGQAIRAIDSHNDTQYKKFASQVDAMSKKMTLILKEAEQEVQRQIEVAKILAETSKAGATVYSQALASAMQTINSSVQIAYREGVDNSATENTSISTSV